MNREKCCYAAEMTVHCQQSDTRLIMHFKKCRKTAAEMHSQFSNFDVLTTSLVDREIGSVFVLFLPCPILFCKAQNSKNKSGNVFATGDKLNKLSAIIIYLVKSMEMTLFKTELYDPSFNII